MSFLWVGKARCDIALVALKFLGEHDLNQIVILMSNIVCCNTHQNPIVHLY